MYKQFGYKKAASSFEMKGLLKLFNGTSSYIFPGISSLVLNVSEAGEEGLREIGLDQKKLIIRTDRSRILPTFFTTGAPPLALAFLVLDTYFVYNEQIPARRYHSMREPKETMLYTPFFRTDVFEPI